MRATVPPPEPEDPYEPGTLEDAWAEYRALHPDARHTDYPVFRSGWRRGFGQGAVTALTTHVHTGT